MAVVNNTASEIGDIIEIRVSVPVVGLIALSSFLDTTEGETASRFFERQFRYSTDGLNFSPWTILSNPNLIAITVNSTDTFFVQYRYIRSGSDNSGLLEWENTTLNGTFTNLADPPIFSNSVFKDYFTSLDLDALAWALNVLEKLYRPGIVPKYINRVGDSVQDADYIKFWKSITIFFSYLVQYARAFENFQNDANLANLYLQNRGNRTCGDETLDQLLYVIENQLRIRSQRGSSNMIKRLSGEVLADGELLRLLCQSPLDFFLLANPPSKYNGWNISNSSPSYRGSLNRPDLNLGYESTKDVVNKNLYPLLQTTYCNVTPDSPKSVLRINAVSANTIAGIGAVDATKAILIDPNVNFEITFQVKQTTLANNLTFGVICLDKDNNVINTQSLITGGTQNNFFLRQILNRNDKYYFVRGIVFNYLESIRLASEGLLNIGIGNHLRFPSTARKIIPYIVLDNSLIGSVSSGINLWDIKVRPSSIEYSRCFLNNKNFIDVIAHNNNADYTDEEIDIIMRNEFIPYNTSFKRNSIFKFTQGYVSSV